MHVVPKRQIVARVHGYLNPGCCYATHRRNEEQRREIVLRGSKRRLGPGTSAVIWSASESEGR